ncbi:MAG: [protein-PII] uridylyltransferase [Desulfobulbaceae bacterium]|uniref:Bifunctional uridylyltransferase/uridylyl-removing enzyme n=1 Tax=Candidatus Desulfobia pelagia TaxID=2841692 RepID=A0A8J6ND42_9BACT|nr:[protein-PII] uridylyltransferase [Candidatus Desulfobia pelagia]
MKEGLRAKRASLETLWKQGLGGKALIKKHTSLMDKTLASAFKHCKDKSSGMALVALGGYGRRELFPFSDIDLMLLHDKCTEEDLTAVAEAVFYPLWDAGLEVGHGVRTPKICLSEAKKDFFLQVSILDAHLLAGSESLYADLISRFQKKFVEGRRKQFVQDMILHCRKRHERFGNHSYLLEPHIKEGKGGFRDIQAMLWTAKVVFSLDDLEAMQLAGLLTREEKQNFEAAWDNLVRIRNRLHYISGRKNDQLFFEHQEEMAGAFQYKDTSGMMGVERFMKELHAHLRTIAVTTDMFFEHVTEVLGLSKSKLQDKALETGITLRLGRIQLTDQELLKSRPHLLLRVFLQSAKTGAPIHHRTRKAIRDHLDIVTDKNRRSKRMAKSFMELISHESALPALTELVESGLLSAYMPEFTHLESLSQHDIYHVFTVDRHLLQCVDEISTLRRSEQRIFKLINTPHILFLAALLHDIGKGYQENHSVYGAKLCKDIGERLGLTAGEIDDLTFLVREHLFLAEIALRRDLEDESLILRCARKVKTPERLSMLYLLTIADARATGPSIWTDWKAALLQELYLKTANALEHAEKLPDNTAQETQWLRDQITPLLAKDNSFDMDILPDDYLQGFSPAEVAVHIQHHTQLEYKPILTTPSIHEAHWSVLIIANDRPGMLSKICGTLALHNLRILSAQIYTWSDGTVIDVIDVASTLDKNFEDQDWEALQNDLTQAVQLRLGLTHRLAKKLKPALRRKSKPGRRPKTRVIFDTQASAHYTVVEVYATNRMGLLYDITHTLSDFGINTYRAIIGSKGDQIVNVFYVLDNKGHLINNEIFQKEIEEALLFASQ